MRNVAPKLGEHNAQIFGRAGVSAPEIARLRLRRTVGQPAWPIAVIGQTLVNRSIACSRPYLAVSSPFG